MTELPNGGAIVTRTYGLTLVSLPFALLLLVNGCGDDSSDTPLEPGPALPSSSADSLPAYQNTLTFDVPYTIEDAAGGIDLVELFFRIDRADYTSYGTFTSSPISFTATVDGFYEFYTVTTDSAGNTEEAPTSADVSTTVDTQSPDAPTLTAEPTHTLGASNTVSWSDESESGAAEYYAEVAADSAFGSNVVDASGWISTTSHTFTNLIDGEVYYYRAMARDVALNESGWSNTESSTQQYQVPDFSLRDVNPTSETSNLDVSPRDYLGRVSAWYFGHAT
jgi:hypothetical protein